MDPTSILNMLSKIREINDRIITAGGDDIKIQGGELELIRYVNDHSKGPAFLRDNPGIKAELVRIANQLKDHYGGEVPKEVTIFLQRIYAPQRGGAKRKRTRRQKLKRARRTRR